MLNSTDPCDISHSGSFIFCRTRRAWLYARETRFDCHHRSYTTLRDCKGNWVGMIKRLQDLNDMEKDRDREDTSMDGEDDSFDDHTERSTNERLYDKEIVTNCQTFTTEEAEITRDKDTSSETNADSDHHSSCLIKPALELVAISQGLVYNSEPVNNTTIHEWKHPERPRNTDTYCFYNVLWIEWQNSVAFRRGLGRVLKDVWERQELEWVDCMLG